MTKDEAMKILDEVIEAMVDRGDLQMQDMAYDVEQVLQAIPERWQDER